MFWHRPGSVQKSSPLAGIRKAAYENASHAERCGCRLGHVYRAERLLSLASRPLTLIPKRSNLSPLRRRAFRDIPIFKLESFTDPHHLSNSCPGTHSCSRQLFGWHEHSFVSHPPSLSLHCTPFPWCKDSAAAIHDLPLLPRHTCASDSRGLAQALYGLVPLALGSESCRARHPP